MHHVHPSEKLPKRSDMQHSNIVAKGTQLRKNPVANPLICYGCPRTRISVDLDNLIATERQEPNSITIISRNSETSMIILR